MMTNDKCLIWGTTAEVGSCSDGKDVCSDRAGGCYIVSRTAISSLHNLEPKIKARLTTWLINQHHLGEEYPLITSAVVNEIKNHLPLSVHERADNLLRYLDAKSDLLGKVVKFYALDNTKAKQSSEELLAWTESIELSEVITLAEYCNEEGWIQHRFTERSSRSGNNLHELMLRPPGYARLAELDSVNSQTKKVFIAMWFDNTMQDSYNKGFAKAVKKAGYEPVRIDRKEHNNKICDEIIAEIRRARFLVADFTQGETGARGGVYYEAGFAHGLNIPVIFTCRKDALDKVHFDTRQYNHIVWEKSEDLYEKLSQRISASIGDGPLKIDETVRA